MGVLKALGQTLFKMFAADLWLTLAAVAAVAIGAAGLSARIIPPGALPFLLAAVIAAALAAAVFRAAKT